MANVSTDLIKAEVESAAAVLQSILERIAPGIPGDDGLPISEQGADDFVRKLRGDLLVVANKCEGLSNILAEGAV